MLQYFRDRLTGALAFVFFGILIIPFAFVGIDSYFTTIPDNAIAKVNDTEITISDFQSSWQRYQQQLRASVGEAFDPDVFDTVVARRGHLEGLINRELMRQYAMEMGLAVSEEELGKRIRAMQAFHIDGQFNADLYQRMLAAESMSPRGFERELARDLVVQQIPAAVMSSSIGLDREVEALAAIQNQQRSFESAIVSASMFTEDTDVSDEAVSEWYKANPNSFLSEEQVVIEYIELDIAAFKATVEFDDEMLEKHFEDQKARFITTEERLTSHILFSIDKDADKATSENIKQKAAALVERIRAGEDFTELAKEYSDDTGSAADGGDLGWIEPGVMVQAFEDTLYELEAGAVSDPVKTGFGYHLILLREIKPSQGMTFAEAKSQLESEYATEQAESLYLEQANRLVDLIYEDPTTLGAAAEELGLEIKTEGPFGRAGGSGIAANTEVAKVAFSELVLQEGASSEPVELELNHVVVLRVNEHMPSSPRAFADVEVEIAAQLKLVAASEKAAAKAEEILAAVANGESLEAIAEAEGLEYQKVEKAQRGDIQYGISLISEVFKLSASDKGYRTLPVDNDYAVVQQGEVLAGATTSPGEATQYKQMIANSAAVVENSGVLIWLREQAKVHINEEKLAGNLY
ncbi:MAG: SurA N-terminal domain-containing protein [Xanthomonadales bacterium]|nr:SurA N-terminal domain-containing protein [Xanthomonadales bacterium]